MRQLPASTWGESFEWHGLEDFVAAHNVPNGVQHIRFMTQTGKAASLDLLVHLIPGSPLVVHFYGAKTKRKPNDTPIFSGLRASQTLSTSYVLVHDPTLSLSTEIGLGWFEGYEGFAAAPLIQAALTHLSKKGVSILMPMDGAGLPGRVG